MAIKRHCQPVKTGTVLATAVAANCTSLHLLKLGFELFDLGMGLLEIFIEAVALRDKLLLPLSEALLFDLNLLCEAFAESFLFLLKFRVIQLAGTGLAELASLHLLSTVRLVMQFLGGVDEIKHVGSN